MGSFVELNDTLQITTEQGFPANVFDLKKHQENPIDIKEVEGKIFEFKDKPQARLYHTAPCRCFLVHNIDGKWLYWGKILIVEQTIESKDEDNKKTSGKYKIIEIYDPEYQKQITKHESSPGLSYF